MLRLYDFWFGPIHPIRLDAFRRLFTVTFLLYMGTWYLDAYEWLTPHGFHLSAAAGPRGEPTPWPTMPAAVVPLFGAAVLVSGLAVILGWKPRLFTWVLLAVALYVRRVDLIAAFSLNKLYVLGYAVLALAPPLRELPLGGSAAPAKVQSAWAVRILQASLIVHYGTAALCKVLHGDWLVNPDILWGNVQGVFRTDAAAWLLRNVPRYGWWVMSYGAFSFEALAPFLLAFRRTRPIAFLWGFGFHMIVAATMHRLIYFSLQMISFYVLFVPEERLLAATQYLKKMKPSLPDKGMAGARRPEAT